MDVEQTHMTATGGLTMSPAAPGNASSRWLATMLRSLLEEKYGNGRVPGVRQISADIARANGGLGISHGHVHNLLKGEADNLTDKTRSLLARFFGKEPSNFFPPPPPPPLVRVPDPVSVQAFAARLASFDAEQIAAIKKAIEIVSARIDDEER
jgi:hypothetical protein